MGNTAKEYLAIATMSDNPAVGLSHLPFSQEDSRRKGMVQIWSLDAEDTAQFARSVPSPEEDEIPPVRQRMTFEIGICVDFGEPRKLKWCPRGGCSEVSIGIADEVYADSAEGRQGRKATGLAGWHFQRRSGPHFRCALSR